ncbi:MAG: hypothetical protein EHM47_12015 [Ignavibacteriales bacterium]|nr:MAG: hypothetical protein EHM47_12015 [Ignavibacteriales bacterium]
MKLVIFSGLIILITLNGCSTLTLKPADFSWPLESVMDVNKDGFVNEERYALSFDSRNMFIEETEDSSSYMNKKIRVIRDTKGFYFITSNNFKNVYVFNVYDGELRLENKILISEKGIINPAFNQRSPGIELIEGDNRHLLSNDGIINEDENEE